MRKILLACLAIVIPLGAAHAESWKNKVTKPGASVTQWGAIRCLGSEKNCWCLSKRKVFTPGQTCRCGSDNGVLKYEGQINQGVGPCG